MNKYLSRLTSSQRGEKFNPLIWPFFISTFAYGIGFAALFNFDGVGKSSLYQAMVTIHPYIPFAWGAVAVLTIIVGFTFLLFNIPPAGKLSGLVGFMVWVFAAFCWGLDGNWLLIFSVALSNMYFWIWQYLSLSVFRREDAADLETMVQYDAGNYDDELNPKDSKVARDDNRGRDRQTEGSYDNPDDGLDTSRHL
jgi:hypothetical protein